MWMGWGHEDRQGRACHCESVKLLHSFIYYCFLFVMVFFLSTCTNFIWYVKCVNARLIFQHKIHVTYIAYGRNFK